jgi:serine protease Do
MSKLSPGSRQAWPKRADSPLTSRTSQWSPAIYLAGFLALNVSTLAIADDDAASSMQATEKLFARAIELAQPSLVTIETIGGTVPGSAKLWGPRGEQPKRQGGYRQAIDASTTGIIVRADGLIATSLFNFNTRPQIITVILADGREFIAELIARDFSKNLALLKIPATDLPAARAATELTVGQWALALGRAYASREPSAHFGIVSAINRISGKALQTDAPASPVNYGGPLIDVEGRVLGVIVPLSPRGEGVDFYDSGIGFAIPLRDILAELDVMLLARELHASFLGVGSDNDYDGPGARIAQVLPDTAAVGAGLLVGDIILEVDGQAVVNRFDLLFQLGRRYAGSSVVLTIRRGETTLKQSVTLGKRPEGQ